MASSTIAKRNSRALLVRTGELLVMGSGAREVRVFSKPGPSRGAEAALLEGIAGNDEQDREDHNHDLPGAALDDLGVRYSVGSM